MAKGDSLYQDQFCEKHNQYYGAHLHECPICVGEKFDISTVNSPDIRRKNAMKYKKDKGV